MKKPYKFDEVDHDITCANPRCNRPLKKNVLARVKEKILVCFQCFRLKEAKRQHFIQGEGKGLFTKP